MGVGKFEAKTATDYRVALNTKRWRARQQAEMIVHELQQGGYLAPRCRGDAACHLADLFYRLDVEITTVEQRTALRRAAKVLAAMAVPPQPSG